MLEFINELITAVIGSPWAYLAIFLACAVDAFLPVVPSDAAVIAAAVVAAAGEQNLTLIVAVAFVGAFVGDHVSYALGRGLVRPAAARVLHGDSGLAAREWAERTLRTRGGVVIMALRFIPGGRTAATLTAGTLGYPLRRFAAFDALAAVSWAIYASLIGYWAGGVFQGNPLLAIAVGIGVSVAIGVVVGSARFLIRRGRRHAFLPGDESDGRGPDGSIDEDVRDSVAAGSDRCGS